MRKKHIDAPAPPVEPEPENDERAAIFTVAELSRRWRVTRPTVTAAIRAGRLNAFRVGSRVYRVREDEVVRYERQHMAVAS